VARLIGVPQKVATPFVDDVVESFQAGYIPESVPWQYMVTRALAADMTPLAHELIVKHSFPLVPVTVVWHLPFTHVLPKAHVPQSRFPPHPLLGVPQT
jgi:hypothetical protein